MRHALAAASIAAATLCSGCIFVGGSTRVYSSAAPIDGDQMADLVGRTRQLRVGMPRQEVLNLYPAQHLNLKSSTSAEGSVFEEWQVEAYSHRGNVHFRRYLYFANDALAAFSDSRIDYRENPGVLRGWANP